MTKTVRETVSIRIIPELWKEAKIYAVRNDMSIGEVVEKAIRTLLSSK